MTPSNSRAFIDREHVYRAVEGVDFGPRTFVLARAPDAMLIWCGGHTHSVNGHVSTAWSQLYLIRERNSVHHGRYVRLGERGGRLSVLRLHPYKAEILKVFSPGVSDGTEQVLWLDILTAVQGRKTLIIEGGGEAPAPVNKRRW